jgi:hypothetical protein
LVPTGQSGLGVTVIVEIPCSTIEQMRLVNTFCWARAYADSLRSGPGTKAVKIGAEHKGYDRKPN